MWNYKDSIIDKKLNIKTSGIREWRSTFHYNRYEATPYIALETLFDNYNIDKSSSFVDFGSGKGRVAFYVHNRFACNVVGVEANSITHGDAVDNKHDYFVNNPNIKDTINLPHIRAEDYVIKDDDNIFYLFNPFSQNILKKVMKNILSSLDSYPRKVDLIIFYTIPEYINYINDETPFKKFTKIEINNKKGADEQFLIYRYTP